MATEAGIPYQSLINLYLRACHAQNRKVDIKWPSAAQVFECRRNAGAHPNKALFEIRVRRLGFAVVGGAAGAGCACRSICQSDGR